MISCGFGDIVLARMGDGSEAPRNHLCGSVARRLRVTSTTPPQHQLSNFAIVLKQSLKNFLVIAQRHDGRHYDGILGDDDQ